MPSSYSTNLKIELQATGENSGTWGTITNTNLGTALEQAVVGYGNPSYPSDANLTLTYTDTNAAQAARALVLNVTSAVSLSATRELVVPTIQKQYIVQNNTSGSQSITVKTSAGTGITVPNGRKAHLYVNGTDVIFMDDYVDINGGSIDGTTIGANSAAAGNFTTVDTTNIEVTNLKAKDGTTAGSIADATGVVTLGSSVLTTTDINGGTIDGTTIGGSSAAAGTFTTLTTSSTVTLNGGTANGVLYLNGSKVATSGSALTFDGTYFTANGLRLAGTDVTNTIYQATGALGISTGSASGITFYTNLANRYQIDATGVAVWSVGGSESMRLTSTGLGIGTASPTQKLHVVGDGNFTRATATDTFIQASNSVATFNITQSANGSTYLYNYGAYNLYFGTNSATRMTLDSSGNLGIGTASPSFRLTASYTAPATFTNASSDFLQMWQASGTNAIGLALNTTGTVARFVTNNGYVFAWNNASSEFMRLDGSGNLGLGVTPSAWSLLTGLQVKNASLAGYLNNSYLFANSYYDGSSNKYIANGFASYYEQSSGKHIWYNAASGTAGNNISFTQAMTLDASGNLVIGATSTSRRLQVNTSLSTAYDSGNMETTSLSTRIVNTDGTVGNYTGIHFATANNSDAAIAGVRTADASMALTFGTRNTGSGNIVERARITSGGDLLVGTTTAAYADAGRGVIEVNGSSESLVGLKRGGSASGYIQSTAADFKVVNSQNTPMLFWTNNTERARIHAGGGMTVGGTQDDGVLTSIQPGATSVQLSLRDDTNARRAIFLGSGYYGYQWAQGIYSNGGKAFLFSNASSVEVGSIVINSGGVAYNTTSDYRLKDNPQPLTGSGAFIDAIQPKTWTWKNTGEKGVGMIAHELAEVSPSSVSGEKDGMRLDRVQDESGKYVEKEVSAYQGVEYGSSELIANLIAEVQSLRQRVAQLESK